MAQVAPGNYFALLGVKPALGRLLDVEDDLSRFPLCPTLTCQYSLLSYFITTSFRCLAQASAAVCLPCSEFFLLTA
jgi:hypothetical protein